MNAIWMWTYLASRHRPSSRSGVRKSGSPTASFLNLGSGGNMYKKCWKNKNKYSLPLIFSSSSGGYLTEVFCDWNLHIFPKAHLKILLKLLMFSKMLHMHGYSGVLFKWEFIIQMRMAYFAPILSLLPLIFGRRK